MGQSTWGVVRTRQQRAHRDGADTDGHPPHGGPHTGTLEPAGLRLSGGRVKIRRLQVYPRQDSPRVRQTGGELRQLLQGGDVADGYLQVGVLLGHHRTAEMELEAEDLRCSKPGRLLVYLYVGLR